MSAFDFQFYSLPPSHVAKVRRSEGVDGLRRRCDEFGELLGEMTFPSPPGDLLERLDDLLSGSLANLCGSEIGDLDGATTKPQAGHLTEDEIADSIDGLLHLIEAIDLDPEDDHDDLELAPTLELHERALQLAEDMDLTFDDDFAELVNDLLDHLKAALEDAHDLVAFSFAGEDETDDR